MTSHTDQLLLDSVPAFISVGGLLKATPQEDGGRRFLYFEASNEDIDHQNEVVLQKALKDSAEYYLRHGNIDLSHYTIMGPKSGIPNFMEYEIGRPVDVQVGDRRTFVKAELYAGDSSMARNANMVWDSITKQTPPARWYPSVGGSVLEKAIRIDPVTKNKVAVITKVRWNNTALDRCPVNRSVPEVSTAAVGTFAKALGGFVIAKALEAGAETDMAQAEGGGALVKQSLDRKKKSYWDMRDSMAEAVQKGLVKASPAAMCLAAGEMFGLAPDASADFVERFMTDLNARLRKG